MPARARLNTRSSVEVDNKGRGRCAAG
jgi:hypothetical protein